MNRPLSETLAEHAAEVDKMLTMLEDILPESKVVGEAPHRDTWIVRFLVGQKFNAEAAAEKFRKMLKMRVKNKVDDIRSKFENGMKPSEIPGFKEHFECCKATFHLQSGDAKDGSPINIQQVARWDYDAYDKLPEEAEDQFQLWHYEYQFFLLDQLSLKTGMLHGFLKVIDLIDSAWEHRERMSHMHAAQITRGERVGAAGAAISLPECYPENTSKIRVLNAPMIATALWWIAKTFLPARTQEEIQIVGAAGVAEEMLTLVHPHVLPKEYGGEFEGKFLM
mmetsp:Transcript_8414/g.19361  ORF Transcript_8414/g.19361 Transcript_8414/m.19361 type:complete len:280 (+) Transcript_8414:114-953(+)